MRPRAATALPPPVGQRVPPVYFAITIASVSSRLCGASSSTSTSGAAASGTRGVAGEVGGTLPAMLNAANEIAVEAFCNRQIKFTDIFAAVTRAMDAHRVIEQPTLEQILGADAWARRSKLNG